MIALTLWLAIAASDAETISKDELILRTYDVTLLTEPSKSAAHNLAMTPLSRLSRETEFTDDPDEETPALMESDLILDIIRTLYPYSGWDENWEMRNPTSRVIEIWAPQAIHDEVSGFLEWLHAYAISAPRVRVRVYELDGITLPSSMTFKSSEAEQRLERLSQSGQIRKIREASLNAQFTGSRSMRDLHSFRLLYQWYSDVANTSAISNPKVESLDLGLEALIHTAPSTDGTLIDLAISQSQLHEIQTRTLGVTATITPKQGGLLAAPHIGRIESPILAFCSLATSVDLKADESLWIPVHTETQIGTSSFLFEIRVEQTAWKVSSLYQASDDRVFGMHAPHAAMGRGFARGTLPPLEVTYQTNRYESFDEGSPFSARLAEFGEYGSLDSMVETLELYSREAIEQGESQIIPLSNGMIVSILPPEDSKRSQEVLERKSATGAMRRLDGVIRSRDGGILAQFSLPCLPNRPASLWSGMETSMISDWEVEIAQEAACSQPVINPLIDGFALKTEVSPFDETRFTVQLQASFHFLEQAPVEISVGKDDNRTIDRVDVEILEIDDTYVLGLGESITSRGGNLSLELTLR